jgi:6-phosphogluconolactonase
LAKWAAVGAKPQARITLTFPTLESSRHAAFLVAGDAKRAISGRLRSGDESLPAARLHPIGTLWMFADEAAAG